MDVKCERCNTEYEFDDALVSGRGTTVKCTNCGHKFKIRRSDGDFSEDFWNVTTGDGRTLVFTSLRELQRAIQGYLVERNDRLSRGGLPPKPIGQIPELAPFFEQREAAKKSQQVSGRPKTQDGLGPSGSSATHHSDASERHAPPPPPPAAGRRRTTPEFPAPPPERSSTVGKSTLIGTGPVTGDEAFPSSLSPSPPTERQPEPSFEAARPLGKTGTQPPPRPPTPPPPPPVPVATRMSAGTKESHTVPMARPTPPPAPPAAPAKRKHGPHGGDVGASSSPCPSRRAARARPIQRSGRVTPCRRGRSVRRPRRCKRRPRLRRPPQPAPPPPQMVTQVVPPPPRPQPLPQPMPAVETSSPLPPPPRMRSLLSEIEEDRDRGRGPSASIPDEVPVRRRSVGGFIVTAVVVGCLLMLGAVWAQKNLGVTLGGKPPPPVATVDPRVASFLANGEKALADGNLELAKESLDKASALSEKDPHVLLGLARLAAIRADVFWLKSRLLPSDAADEHRVTRDSLNELAAGARKAADDALAVAPEDPAVLRAKIDTLRISGDRDGARALVGKITPSASQPESAYVLASLDLAEVEPLWPTVIERLKAASSVETGPGRARAALVFALVRSGDVEGAKAEVARLAAMTKPHPLLSLLRGFADRAKVSTKLDGGLPDGAVAMDVPDAGKGVRASAGTAGGAAGTGGGGEGLPSDPRQLVAQGERARAKGDFDRARTLFSAAIDKNPNDSEALSGLAAISYAQRDLSGARGSYKRVLAINPNYMPALIGLADVEWDSGDKGAAAKMYKDIVDRYPPGAYPERVSKRSEGGG